MRVVLRIVAVLVMLMALLEGVTAVLALQREGGTSEAEQAPAGARPSPAPRLPAAIQRYCEQLHGPAQLFCLGAILLALIHIAAAQDEEDADPRPAPEAGPPAPGAQP
jgi:hypothetical protein